ncbi:MAG: CocE/NonD family hydrolase, partial [Candidatus Bathyarchaeia archaeon]
MMETAQISEFGRYSGYSKPHYDGWTRNSQYIEVRDGVKLAVDIFRPSKNGRPASEPLPLVWTHTRYRRSIIENGKRLTWLDQPHLQTLVKHGYVVGVVDARGSGASFGIWKGIFTNEETRDSYDLIEWFAKQPWCDGSVGMFGGSYQGMTQLMVAAMAPPHLKAIIPWFSFADLYEVAYPGGIFRDDLARTWSDLTKFIDTVQPAAPVDSDSEGALLKKANETHKLNRSILEILSPLRFRNDNDEATGCSPYFDWSPGNYFAGINKSGVAVYLWGGWFDAFVRDTFVFYRNLDVPKRMTIGPWSHSAKDVSGSADYSTLYEVEQLRWFDFWLRGIENGIMDEPPIRYFTLGVPESINWKTTQQWPPPRVEKTPYYFHGGPSGSIHSVNDGVLDTGLPRSKGARDEYQVDYSTTSGQKTRWDNVVVPGNFDYPDMTSNDVKALTYTTMPLSFDIEVTGHPIITLWVGSTANDADFFAYLEEVDQQRVSRYVTEGVQKASHRAVHNPPFDYLGLPWHRSFKEDIVNLVPGAPAELSFDMHPISHIFK